jgi:protein-S-isoprenylcysteine O-methyltransferase Ste14
MSDDIPNWAKAFAHFQRISLWDFPGTKRVKLAWAINFHKIITLFIIIGMMFYFDNFSTSAWVYLSLHGIYGYCWLIKDFGFRDHRWETKVSLMGAINMYVTLVGWYWLIPYLFFAYNAAPSNVDLFFAIALHTLGVVTTVAADCQRHFTLKYRKGLMTDGLFRYTRNPNYLGEIMIYSSFAYLANHWLGWTIIAYVTVTTFIPNMLTKDASISRYLGWEQYKASSGLLVPWALINGRALRELFSKDKSYAQE